MFTISQMWFTSHPRSTVVLQDNGTPGTSREIYSEDAVLIGTQGIEVPKICPNDFAQVFSQN